MTDENTRKFTGKIFVYFWPSDKFFNAMLLLTTQFDYNFWWIIICFSIVSNIFIIQFIVFYGYCKHSYKPDMSCSCSKSHKGPENGADLRFYSPQPD